MVLPLLVPIANNDETLYGEIDNIDIILTITNVLFKTKPRHEEEGGGRIFEERNKSIF